jgi:hypothetical protein
MAAIWVAAAGLVASALFTVSAASWFVLDTIAEWSE